MSRLLGPSKTRIPAYALLAHSKLTVRMYLFVLVNTAYPLQIKQRTNFFLRLWKENSKKLLRVYFILFRVG